MPLKQRSYWLIQLPHNYNNSLSELVVHIESIIEANEKYHRRKCEKFYIGKSTIRKREEHFHPDDQDTWDTELIDHHWRDRKKDTGGEYEAMAVLTVTTKDTLPPLESRKPDQWKEQYTVALKQGLITHFMFVEDDDRLENYNTKPGKFAEGDAQAHVLYLALKFKQ